MVRLRNFPPISILPIGNRRAALGRGGEPEQVWSWHGLMNHDETLWRITTDGPPAELIGRFQKRFKEAGWEEANQAVAAARPSCA